MQPSRYEMRSSETFTLSEYDAISFDKCAAELQNHNIALLTSQEDYLPSKWMQRWNDLTCGICGRGQSDQTRLIKCDHCCLVHYCCKQHERDHEPLHNQLCVQARRARMRLVHAEQILLQRFRLIETTDYLQVNDQDDDQITSASSDNGLEETEPISLDIGSALRQSGSEHNAIATSAQADGLGHDNNHGSDHEDEVSIGGDQVSDTELREWHVTHSRNLADKDVFRSLWGQLGAGFDDVDDHIFISIALCYIDLLTKIGTKTSYTLALQLSTGLHYLTYAVDSYGIASMIEALCLLLDDMQEFHNIQNWHHVERHRFRGAIFSTEDTAIFSSPYNRKSRKWSKMSLITLISFTARLYLKLETAYMLLTTNSIMPLELMEAIAVEYLTSLGLRFDQVVDRKMIYTRVHKMFKQLNHLLRQLCEVDPTCLRRLTLPYRMDLMHDKPLSRAPCISGFDMQHFFWQKQDRAVLELLADVELIANGHTPSQLVRIDIAAAAHLRIFTSRRTSS